MVSECMGRVPMALSLVFASVILHAEISRLMKMLLPRKETRTPICPAAEAVNAMTFFRELCEGYHGQQPKALSK